MMVRTWMATALALVGLGLSGCDSAESLEGESVAIAPVEKGQKEQANAVESASEQENEAPSPPASASSRTERRSALRSTDAPAVAPNRRVTRASSRPTVPKGMDAHKDFTGARVGLIQTANVMGEVDPCG